MDGTPRDEVIWTILRVHHAAHLAAYKIHETDFKSMIKSQKSCHLCLKFRKPSYCVVRVKSCKSVFPPVSRSAKASYNLKVGSELIYSRGLASSLKKKLEVSSRADV